MPREYIADEQDGQSAKLGIERLDLRCEFRRREPLPRTLCHSLARDWWLIGGADAETLISQVELQLRG